MRTLGKLEGVITNPPRYLLLFCIVIFILLAPVCAEVTAQWDYAFNNSYDTAHYNISVQRQDHISPNTTPWELFIGSLILGIVLFLYSIRQTSTLQDLEASIIIAVMSIVSIGYCCYASLSIDRITGYGVAATAFPMTNTTEYVYMENHLTYSEPVISILMLVFFFVAIGYTIYRVARHPAFVSGGSE